MRRYCYVNTLLLCWIVAVVPHGLPQNEIPPKFMIPNPSGTPEDAIVPGDTDSVDCNGTSNPGDPELSVLTANDIMECIRNTLNSCQSQVSVVEYAIP